MRDDHGDSAHSFFYRDLTATSPGHEPPPSARPDAQIRRVCAALAQRQSVVLLGPHGVGKTNLLNLLASRLKRGEAPPELKGVPIYETSCSQLISGTEYVGQWDTKVVQMVQSLKGRGILYVTDAWNLMGTGSAHHSPKDVFGYLRPRIQAGDVVLLAEMTEERYQNTVRRERAFGSCFMTVKLAEPPQEVTRSILEFHARMASERLKIEVGPMTLARILEVTGRFIPYEVFPGKAVKLLKRILTEAQAHPQVRAIEPASVFDVFSADTGLPRTILDAAHPLDPEQAAAFFTARVLHQEEAVGRVVDSIALYKARLNDPLRPIAVMVFVGPTGVGKTELAKAIAEYLFGSAQRLVRLDMSEFATPDATDRLAGGFVGPDGISIQEGLLAGPVRQQPFSVVLLDEFEKAHPSVYDLMLQVFSEGRLTDSRGETTDFRNAIIVLTSNLGSQRLTGGLIGFSRATGARRSALRDKVAKEMEATFRPEFLNRLDHVVVFNPLDERATRRIARRELGRLHEVAGIRQLKLTTQIEESVLELAVRRGFDPRFGARPLKRAIQELVLTPIARFLVSRPVSPGAIVKLDVEGDRVTVDLLETAESEAARMLTERLDVAAGAAPARMTVAQMNESIQVILTRLDSVESTFALDAAKERLAGIETRQSEPDFWDDPEEARSLYREMQRLSSDIGRLEKARELARTVKEFSELALAERDASLGREIGAEYARLVTLLESLEQEATLFEADDRRDAIVILEPAGPDPLDPTWIREVLALYEGWARRHGYQVTVLYHPEAARQGRAEVAIRALVEGTFAYGYLAGETGLHKLIRHVPGRRRNEVENLVARVWVHPLLEAHQAAASDLSRDYAFRSLGAVGKLRMYQVTPRAGAGEGALLLANGLSEETNAWLGRRVLRSIASQGRRVAELVRTYDATEHDVVKDRRTGHKVHGLRRVLAGEIDEFLLSYLKERRAVAVRPGEKVST